MRIAPVVLAAAVALLVPAAGLAETILNPDSEGPAAVQLDVDRARERVRPQLKRLTAEFSQRRAVVEDDCRGKTLRYRMTEYQDYLQVSRVQIDGRGRPELFATASSGASGRLQYATIARLDRSTSKRTCHSYLRFLFRYPTRRTKRPVGGGYEVGGSYSVLGNFSSRYRGRELRLTEGLYNSRDAGCCPSRRRTSYWRYMGGDRKQFVRFRSRIERLEPER